jgi:predicted RNA polymerase sigma factor
MGKRAGAISDLDAALATSPAPRPETYRERARMILESEKPDRVRALAGLDQGIARLGPIISLVLPAVELEVELGRHEAALARLDDLEPQFDLRSPLLARRAEILMKAGRVMEAHATYTEALSELEDLSEQRRNSVRIRELEQRIRTALRVNRGSADGETGE